MKQKKGKIPDVSSLATKTALTALENKIPHASSLVKKTDYNTKVTEIAVVQWYGGYHYCITSFN